MCLRVTRQGASAFNQPLSLDTSSVTNMGWMLKVRVPSVQSAPPCTLRAPPPPPTRPPHALAPPTPLRRPPHVPRCDSGQEATAFNQPLTLDTSSNTNMHYMFYVRSPLACRAPQCPVGVFRAHAACTGTTSMPSRHYPLVAFIPWYTLP